MILCCYIRSYFLDQKRNKLSKYNVQWKMLQKVKKRCEKYTLSISVSVCLSFSLSVSLSLSLSLSLSVCGRVCVCACVCVCQFWRAKSLMLHQLRQSKLETKKKIQMYHSFKYQMKNYKNRRR